MGLFSEPRPPAESLPFRQVDRLRAHRAAQAAERLAAGPARKTHTYEGERLRPSARVNAPLAATATNSDRDIEWAGRTERSAEVPD